MALNGEWTARVTQWLRELRGQLFRPLAAAKLEMFTTIEHLTPQQAARGKFRPVKAGQPWGEYWEYGWFRVSATTPKEAAGKVVALDGSPLEGLVFIDGKVISGNNGPHHHHELASRGRPGQKFDLLMEIYAGHGDPSPWMGGGPHPVGWTPRLAAKGPLKTVPDIQLGVWNEDVYQLIIDVETLQSLRNALPADSMRAAEIDKALMRFTQIVDVETSGEELTRMCVAGRKHLAGVLKCVNGSTAPDFFCFGHGHLDTAWLWPLAETERKAARTVSTQMALADRYKGYNFLMTQPAQYAMLQHHYPELYARVKKAVAQGKVIAEGGMWVEADTNVPSGESLIRQFIHGKRFFREQFGLDNKFLWLPDVFGYCGQLPQIMKGCSVEYFATTKVFWISGDGEHFPCMHFMWEGIDGSEVPTHVDYSYGWRTDPGEMSKVWNMRCQKNDITMRMIAFGHGDGGGGPTREHLEFIQRQKDLEGAPRLRHAAPAEFFEEMIRRGEHLHHRYVGELYFQNHRGTYTTQARTKKLNRASEWALREAEMWGAAASATGGFRFPLAAMDAAWKKVLLNQFHDIIPGSSIARVYQEAERDYAEVIAQAGEVRADAQGRLAGKGKGLVVFNSLSWDRKALVELPADFKCPCDASGNPLPVQKVGRKLLAEVSAPSCGWTTISGEPCGAEARPAEGDVKATPSSLENDVVRVKFNARGEVTSFFDKTAQRELTAGLCNEFRLYKDVPVAWDAWNIDPMYEQEPVEVVGESKVEVLTSGPLVASLRVTRKINNSSMVQEISLRRGSARLDFAPRIDWHERHRLLKVAFPVDVHAMEAVYEIQFGHLRRPTHRSRQFDADRFEVCHQKWAALAEEGRGAAILNDSKYGISTLGNTMSLTLLRSSVDPDETADRGVQEFTYSLLAWNGPLAAGDVVREAYELNCPVTTAEGDAGERSLFAVDAANIVIETIKPAEDGSGDVIVRLYEAMRTNTRATLTTALPVKSATAVNMLEEPQSKLRLRGGSVTLDFRPFEVKTVRLAAAK